MKMFRPALDGILPAFVLLICLPPLARAASMAPSSQLQSWFTADDMASHHIWLPVGMPYSGPTYPAPKIAPPSDSRKLGLPREAPEKSEVSI